MFQPEPDFYAVLQVHEKAEQDTIEFTYKKLSKKYHPDVNDHPDALEHMVAINQAYEILGSPLKRARYDRARVAASKTSVQHAPREDVCGGTAASGATEASGDALRTLQQYFTCIRDGLYHDAYRLLSASDRKTISVDRFVSWRVSVDAFFRIVRFRIGPGTLVPDFEAGQKSRAIARRFVVEIQEEKRDNGQITEYAMIKFMVQEGGAWRMHLGYYDLDAMTRRFEDRAIAEQSRAGMMSAAAFAHRIDQEVYRQKRYGHMFTLGVLDFSYAERARSPGFEEQAATLAGTTFAKMLRVTDAIGYLDAMRYGVLFGETSHEAARIILERLADAFFRQAEDAHDVALACEARLVPTQNRDAAALLAACRGSGTAAARDRKARA